MVDTGGWGTGNAEVLFDAYRISVLQGGKSSGDWMHSNVSVLNPTIHFQRVKMAKFMLCIYFAMIF